MEKIAIVGCGKIAEKHLIAYKLLRYNDIILCDLQPRLAQKMAEQFGCQWASQLDEILADQQILAVDICTPTSSHEKLISQAILAGKHVFCEKPLTDNFHSAKKLQELAITHERLLMVGFLYRFHPAFQLIKQILSERLIGVPYLAWFRLGGRGSHRLWKHRKDQGGGAVNEMLVHMLDLALWYFGKLDITKTHISLILPQRQVDGETVEVDAEDFALVNLTSREGVQIFCQADLVTPSYMNYLEIMGTEGSIFTSILDHFPTVIFCKQPRGIFQQGNNFFTFPKTNLFEKELAYFLDCLKNGFHPEFNSLADSLEVMMLVDKIKRG